MIMAHVIGFVVACLILNLQVVLGCINGWETFEGSCYFVSEMREDWLAASSACKLYHAYLAEITSAKENNYIHQLIRKFHTGHRDVEYWLGGTDGFVEGDWIWIESGLRINYTDWYRGQPSNYNHREEDCALFSIHRDTYHWDDQRCSEQHPFVCEVANGGGSAGILVGRK